MYNFYGQEATEVDMEQQTGTKWGQEYIKAVYCHRNQEAIGQLSWRTYIEGEPAPHLASSGSILPVFGEPLLLPLSPCDSDKMLHTLAPKVVL